VAPFPSPSFLLLEKGAFIGFISGVSQDTPSRENLPPPTSPKPKSALKTFYAQIRKQFFKAQNIKIDPQLHMVESMHKIIELLLWSKIHAL